MSLFKFKTPCPYCDLAEVYDEGHVEGVTSGEQGGRDAVSGGGQGLYNPAITVEPPKVSSVCSL